MLWLVQVALDTQLYNNIIYDGKTVPVYDSIPDQSTLPYIRFGEDTVSPWDTKTTYGKDMTHTLHVFSDQGWNQEVKEIMRLIEVQLRNPITIDGHKVVIAELEFQEVFEEENNIKHGAMRFRFRIQED